MNAWEVATNRWCLPESADCSLPAFTHNRSYGDLTSGVLNRRCAAECAPRCRFVSENDDIRHKACSVNTDELLVSERLAPPRLSTIAVVTPRGRGCIGEVWKPIERGPYRLLDANPRNTRYSGRTAVQTLG